MERRKKTAVITGGTRGIGLGIAEALAQEGFDLMLCGRRTSTEVESVVEALRRPGQEVAYVRADVASRADREALLGRTREIFGRLDVLVNNAGRAPFERLDILNATEESYDAVMETNLKGPYFLTQEAARWMVEQRREGDQERKSIHFVTSVSATMASIRRGEYCISKAGLAMAAQLWAVRLAEFDIPVYEIRPGIIETDMTAGVRAVYDERIRQGMLLQRRWGTREDVGRVVAALARGDLAYSTGQVILVDGGMTVGRI